MNGVSIVARKEFRTAFRNRLFVTVAGLFLAISILSVYIGAATRRTEMRVYNETVATLTRNGATSLPKPPEIHTLTILSNLTEYISIVGAILAVTLGFDPLIREREAGTLKLILSRPVFRDSLLTGKLLGNSSLIALLLGIIFVFNLFLLVAVGGIWPTPGEVLRLAGAIALGFLYMLIFLSLSMMLSTRMKDSSTVFLVSLVIWMLVSFVIPQMAETMMTNSAVVNSISGVITQVPQDTLISRTIEYISPTWHLRNVGGQLLEAAPGGQGLASPPLMLTVLTTSLALAAPSVVFIAFAFFLISRDESLVLG